MRLVESYMLKLEISVRRDRHVGTMTMIIRRTVEGVGDFIQKREAREDVEDWVMSMGGVASQVPSSISRWRSRRHNPKAW